MCHHSPNVLTARVGLGFEAFLYDPPLQADHRICSTVMLIVHSKSNKTLDAWCSTIRTITFRNGDLVDIDPLHMRRGKELTGRRLSDVGADYLISSSYCPESCCCRFAFAELTYLNVISHYKSIWGFVFLFVSLGCLSKSRSTASTSLATEEL